MDVLKPEMKLLVKLASIAIHADELTSSSGHHFDIEALKSLINDSEVKGWLEEMDKLALTPIKRKKP